MTWVITLIVDFGDGVCIGGKTPPPHFNPMTNTELTLDQLQAVAGGATAIEYGLIAAAVPPSKVEDNSPPWFQKKDGFRAEYDN